MPRLRIDKSGFEASEPELAGTPNQPAKGVAEGHFFKEDKRINR